MTTEGQDRSIRLAISLSTRWYRHSWWPTASHRHHHELAEQLASAFDVPLPFMDERLKLLKRRLYEIAMEVHMANAVAEASAGYDYSYRYPANPRIELLVQNGSIVGQMRRTE
jgi:hypothetical protein